MPCFKRDIKVTWLVQTGYISIQFIKDRTLKYAMFQTGYKGDLVSETGYISLKIERSSMPCFKRDIKVTWLVETAYQFIKDRTLKYAMFQTGYKGDLVSGNRVYTYLFSSLKIERSSTPCFKRDIKVTWLVETGYISIQFIKDRMLKYAMFQTGYKGDLVSANRIQFIKDRTLKYAMFQTGYKGDLVSANRIYIYSIH